MVSSCRNNHSTYRLGVRQSEKENAFKYYLKYIYKGRFVAGLFKLFIKFPVAI